MTDPQGEEAVPANPAGPPDTPRPSSEPAEPDELLSHDPYIQSAFDQVPSIGDGHRWYDYPYKVLRGLQFPSFGKHSPRWFTNILSRGWIALTSFNELERDKAWSPDDPSRNLKVPADEHVTIPGIWVAEFFPPSEIHHLSEAFARNGWDRSRIHLGPGGENVQQILERSRQGGGWAWWRLGSTANESSTPYFSGTQRRKLPSQIDEIEHIALQIGDGLTVVVSYFGPSKLGQRYVDDVWHGSPDPRIVRRGDRRVSEDRLWAAYSVTQEARRTLHELARQWMTDRCPGIFAHSNEPQPLMDLLLFAKHDSGVPERQTPEMRDPLHALGIGIGSYRLTSAQLPGLLLDEIDERLAPEIRGKNTWYLWGQLDKAAAVRHDLENYTDEEPRAIGHKVNDYMRDVFPRLALSEFLTLKREQNASLRDTARAQHGKFGRKDLKLLRDNFLTSSLDTSSIARDIGAFKAGSGRFTSALFYGEPAPWMRRSNSEQSDGDEREDFLNKVSEQQEKVATELVVFDADYRDILSTVASIGSSIYAFRVQRYAMAIAVLSIFIAVMALLSEDARTALGATVWGWLIAVWPWD